MKRLLILLGVMLFVFSFCQFSYASRIWTSQQISINGDSFDCGCQPSMALLYGVQPVISNYNAYGCSEDQVVHETAFGWYNYSISPGYVAGDGNRNIQSYTLPLNYGQNGEFYSSGTSGNYIVPVTLGGYVGPNWYTPSSLPNTTPVFVDADSSGTVYMACGSHISMCLGSTIVNAAAKSIPLTYATDMDVSSYGDIAISGGQGALKSVDYYDYKSGCWNSHYLCTNINYSEKIDVEWDSKGNLGVAYFDSSTKSVKFDYLDMQTSNWTSDIIYSDSSQYTSFTGAALAYDRFDDPVIACGSYLFYDGNPSSVPEPSSFAALAMGGIALLGFLKKRN